MGDDDIKNAAEIREWLTKLIVEKQDEIERIKTTLSLIDIVLKQGSFRTAANLNINSSKKVLPFQQRKGSSNNSSGDTDSNDNYDDGDDGSSSSSSGNNSSIRTGRSDYGRTTDKDMRISSSSSKTTVPPQSQSSNRNNPYLQRENRREDSTPIVNNREMRQSRGGEEGEQEGEQEFEETRQLKRMKDGLVLATVRVSKNIIEIVPENTITLYVDTPPFKSFFLNRILEGMKNKDLEKVRQGQLNENQMLRYDVNAASSDNNNNNADNKKQLKKVQISNYREKERITEIFNTSAWVFTRMLEKSENFSKRNSH